MCGHAQSKISTVACIILSDMVLSKFVKTDKQFINIQEDNIPECGDMKKLISSYAMLRSIPRYKISYMLIRLIIDKVNYTNIIKILLRDAAKTQNA